MFNFLKEKYHKLTDKVFGWFGYYTPEHVNNVTIILSNQLNDAMNQIDGLTYAFGDFNKRHKDMILIIIGLMMILGKTEMELKLSFLQGIFENGTDLDADNDKEGNILLKLVESSGEQENGDNVV